MQVRSALESLTLPPAKFLTSSWPWRSLLYLGSGAVLGVATGAVLAALMLLGMVLTLVVIGLAALLAFALSGIAVARIERWRLRLVDAVTLPDQHRRVAEPGLRAWVRTRLREQATWRELGYAIVLTSILTWLDMIVFGVATWAVTALLCGPLYIRDEPLYITMTGSAAGLVLGVIALYPVTAWAAARAAMTRSILAPRAEEDPQLVELTRSRARLVDAFEVERRRIERDLHDGAQQRLVALSMQLGLARLELPDGSPAADPVRRAHDLAKEALAELRELIRGVHPKILTDRGLAAAVREVADRAPLPVGVDIALPARLPGPVEVTAYFVVVEALANVAKHSGANRARVVASVAFDRLTVQVRDDGRGGADPARGTGLAGLVDRVAAVGGTVALASPHGGPTVVHVELPCGS
ncbi:sensor domain-containing protein [Dactylosporangium aurantiacum]|uniref:histidine kinase n=1 Tax=Dactylosporangium aurantiacum TaxID=35754 RepID=A0A9Q9MGG5_9ACTN|nr:sensor histidine kinase [Dactylosporangium aurantiacum]MDG6104925.1 sensor domain-containing protein [Dactylosporangium aurantiacum]UWZ55539.1 sensor domain-containing protein [Dactylosporangium aurantiacum]